MLCVDPISQSLIVAQPNGLSTIIFTKERSFTKCARLGDLVVLPSSLLRYKVSRVSSIVGWEKACSRCVSSHVVLALLSLLVTLCRRKHTVPVHCAVWYAILIASVIRLDLPANGCLIALVIVGSVLRL